MADGEEEQFSLCWNNYNTNLSTGFHESLCRGDLVDVTLAAEGHLVQAHRLVLSVCSPYFQKMFTQMPANQHAFVFLKDVPHAALKDLIQFMYCGEVNVKQDALPTFISTAEALQIKGLTENGDSTAQTPAAQSTHIPIKATTSTPANVQSRPRAVPQRSATRNASYKMDSEDSSDDKPTTVVVQGQKRVLQRPVVAQTAKRVKTVDPLDGGESTRSAGQSSAGQSTSAHIVQVASASDKVGEPEFIDLPIETLPTKAEPDYGDEGEVEEGDGGEATYVEDSESYGDMKYDESYFTEGEDTGKSATASGFTESYTEGDTSANEAQGSVIVKKARGRPRTAQKKENKTYDIDEILNGETHQLELVTTKIGGMKAAFQNHFFEFHFNRNGNKFWRCVSHSNGCPAKIMSKGNVLYIVNVEHNHEPEGIRLVNTAEMVGSEESSCKPRAPNTTVTVIPVAEDFKQKLKDRISALGRSSQK